MISSPRRLTQGINIQYADIQLEIKFLDLPRDRAPQHTSAPGGPPCYHPLSVSPLSAGVPLGMWGDCLGSDCQ